MNNSLKLFAPHLTMFGVEDKFNTRINTNYIAQYWAANAKQHKQKSAGTGYKRTLAKFGTTKPKIGGDIPSVPPHPIQNLVNSHLRGGEYQLQLSTMNRRDKRSMFLYNQHLQGGDYQQQPSPWNDKSFTVHQQAGNPYTSWQKRNSGDATNKGSQSKLKLTGQTPQALVGHETEQRYSYGSGGFPTIKSGGLQTNHRLQNTLNNSKNKFFQQWDDHLTGNQSERSFPGLRGHFAQQEPQQFDPTRFFMVGNRKVPPSFRHQYHGQSNGSGRFPYDGILPSISKEKEDNLEEGYRYKYSSRGSGDQNTSELIGRYAKYYRTQEHGAKGKKSTSTHLRSVPSPVEQPNDKNSELLSRYLKHSAKKQVRAGSIHAPKYMGDYDPNVYTTGKVSLNEKAPLIPQSTSKEGSQEEIKDLLFNKQEAAAEQKYRLEKATFPTSLDNSKKDNTNLQEKGKYQLMYTKRKKMVVASTSDRENDPSMLVKGGDDVTTGTTEDSQEEVQEVAERPTPEPTETALDISIPSPPVPKKPLVKRFRKPSTLKVLPKIEAKQTDKKTDEAKSRRKSIKSVDIKRDSKKVEALEATPEMKFEENQGDETAAEELQIQSLNEEEWLHVEENHNEDDNEGQQNDVANEKDDEEGKKAKEEEEDPLAALIPLRAKADSLRISSMTGFLPITPVTFSWFPMSQQHKEEFRKMSEQSKVPPSMRPFRNKNNK